MQSPRPQTPRYELVAHISKTIGRDGQLVALEQGELSVLRCGLEVWVVPPSLEGVRHSTLCDVKRSKHKSGLLISLEGVGDRTQASELVDRYLLARIEDITASDQLASCSEKENYSLYGHAASTQNISGELHSKQLNGKSEQSNCHFEQSKESFSPREVDDGESSALSFVDVAYGDLGALVRTKVGPAYDIWVVEGPYGILEIPAVEAYLAADDVEYDDANSKDAGELILLNLPPGFIEVTAQNNKKDSKHAH